MRGKFNQHQALQNIQSMVIKCCSAVAILHLRAAKISEAMNDKF